MGRIVDRIQALALALGAPGLFIVAVLDSSILSLPEIADLLVILMVIQHKSRLVLYASAATLGSLVGCLALYYVGRRGGDAFIRKRFHPASVDKTLNAFRRYGVVAVLIPSVLPPPAPFKIFVLLAGVAGIRPLHFTAAIIIGRGARYFTEGLLAVWYGEQAVDFVRENGRIVALIIVAALAIGFGGYIVWRRVQAGRAYNSHVDES
jgi:membrane protein YqaA with SNARE-associated domain